MNAQQIAVVISEKFSNASIYEMVETDQPWVIFSIGTKWFHVASWGDKDFSSSRLCIDSTLPDGSYRFQFLSTLKEAKTINTVLKTVASKI